MSKLWYEDKSFDQITAYEPDAAILNLHEDCLCLAEQRGELAARVAELEGALVEASNNGAEADDGAWFYGFNSERLDELLNHKPAQSLLLHDAGVLEKYAGIANEGIDVFPCGDVGSTVYAWLNYQAGELRKEEER